MTRSRRTLLAASACVSLALAACTGPAPTEGPSPGLASATPVAASPSPSPSPSPAPSPSPSPTTAPDLSEDEALAAARARRAEREDCDTGFADDAHAVIAETEGRMLVHVVCFVGAYQPSGELRVWDGTALDPLPVEQWQFGDVLTSPEVVGFIEASADGTTVVNEVKYRGLGDCGLHQRWTYDGTELRLELAREQECSDDGTFVPPDQWPVVFER